MTDKFPKDPQAADSDEKRSGNDRDSDHPDHPDPNIESTAFDQRSTADSDAERSSDVDSSTPELAAGEASTGMNYDQQESHDHTMGPTLELDADSWERNRSESTDPEPERNDDLEPMQDRIDDTSTPELDGTETGTAESTDAEILLDQSDEGSPTDFDSWEPADQPQPADTLVDEFEETSDDDRGMPVEPEVAQPADLPPTYDQQSFTQNTTAEFSPSMVDMRPQPAGPHGMPSSEERLVEQTKQQIRTLVREIAQLAQSDVSPSEFYEGFLGRVVSALAAEGGAIWMLDDTGRLELQYQIGIQKTGLVENEDYQMRHALLLKKSVTAGKPMIMAPQSGSADDEEAGNPTSFLLLLGTVKINQDVQGLVEVFQRTGAGPATQRGYLRFVVEMCDIVGDFLKSSRLRQYGDRQSLWQKLEQFIKAVHTSLDPKSVSYTIANEARRFIECDRVSVARSHGTKISVVAVSGSDNIDPRASTIRDLGRLATVVAATREPIWYTGSSEDMPPQIEKTLQAYVDQSHSKMVAVLPLKKQTDEDEVDSTPGQKQVLPEVVGALVVENVEDNRVDMAMKQRVDVVVQHSSSALGNAEEHHGLFLMPVWRVLGKASWIVKGRTLPKTIAVAVIIMATLIALCVIPADFDLKAEGELQPEIRRDIFSRVDGMVTKVFVEDLERVTKGQKLALLDNIEIDAELEGLFGNLNITEQREAKFEHQLLYNKLLTQQEKVQIQTELESTKIEAKSYQKQISLFNKKKEHLTVKSPIDGMVVAWKVVDQLERRPVKTGQVLMTVVDPESKWELELFMPESRMGYVGKAWNEAQKADEKLRVDYKPKTDARVEFQGHVTDIHGAADIHGDEGNTVKIRVAIDRNELTDPRPGTTVIAKVQCGQQPIGFVWLHDLIAWIQTNILFWL